jgi:hypothetical protein
MNADANVMRQTFAMKKQVKMKNIYVMNALILKNKQPAAALPLPWKSGGCLLEAHTDAGNETLITSKPASLKILWR